MASGWAGDGAVQDQIQDSINDEVARARRNLPTVSYTHLDVYKRQIMIRMNEEFQPKVCP